MNNLEISKLYKRILYIKIIHLQSLNNINMKTTFKQTISNYFK